jgi:ribosomal protein L13E
MSEKAAKKKAKAKPAAKKRAKPKASEEESKPVDAQPVMREDPPTPIPWVMARHDGGMQERRAKGFSGGELSVVGLTLVRALSMKVPIDLRRSSVLEGNVGTLKAWYKPPAKKPKQPKAEKAEEEKPKATKKAAKKTKKA